MAAFGGGGIGQRIPYFISGSGGGRSAVQVTKGVDAVTAGGGGGGSDCFKDTPVQDCGGGGGDIKQLQNCVVLVMCRAV